MRFSAILSQTLRVEDPADRQVYPDRHIGNQLHPEALGRAERT